MILLLTNRAEYRNDIAEEIRLFYGQTDVSVAAEDAQSAELVLRADILPEHADARIHAYAEANGLHHAESMEMEGEDALSVKRVEKRAVKIAVFRLLQKIHPTATPWGSLTGIRPTKLFRELTAAHGEDGAWQCFRKAFDVSEEKTSLARTICRVQHPVIDSVDKRDADVYVNIPFCKTKCLYCSFPSQILGKNDVLTPYLETLFTDIAAGAELAKDHGYHLRCMYIGGGTPTVLSAKQLDALLAHLASCYGSLGSEITVEAGRPDTIDAEKLSVIRSHGVQRISINPQSMNDATLERIGRAHSAADVKAAYRMAREAGFPVINMDLIAGLPGETAEDMQDTLEQIKELSPDSLTVHALAMKRASRLTREQKESAEDATSHDTEKIAMTLSKMIDMAADYAKDMDLVPYYLYRQKNIAGNFENVGYAKVDKAGIYNILIMEEKQSIIAVGAGASTKIVVPEDKAEIDPKTGNKKRIVRVENVKDVEQYINRIDEMIERKGELLWL